MIVGTLILASGAAYYIIQEEHEDSLKSEAVIDNCIAGGEAKIPPGDLESTIYARQKVEKECRGY